MKEIITTGKTVDLAIEEACRQLQTAREKVEFEIIDLPKKGLFGLKTYPAKVRVFVKENKEEMAVEYITAVLKAMGVQDFTAEANRDGENLNITLKGDDLGFVIGRRGETIDAIQYLASLAVNRLDGDYMRITIDSGNFREKREKTFGTQCSQERSQHDPGADESIREKNHPCNGGNRRGCDLFLHRRRAEQTGRYQLHQSGQKVQQ